MKLLFLLVLIGLVTGAPSTVSESMDEEFPLKMEDQELKPVLLGKFTESMEDEFPLKMEVQELKPVLHVAESMDEEFPLKMEVQEFKPLSHCKFAESMDEEFPLKMEDQEFKPVSNGKFAESMDEEFPPKMEVQELKPVSYCNYQNLALHGRATQSSIFNDPRAGFKAIAINAIDGNQDTAFHHGSCIHTEHDWSPWWRVDLLQSYRINYITITNRGDCCEHRLDGAEILVGDSLTNNGNNNQRCAVVTAIARGATQDFCCNNMVGRYVNIVLRDKKEYLHVCEVQVWSLLLK